MRWISKISTGGVKNFAVGAGRGRRSKLESKQELEVQRYIEEHGAHLNTEKVRVFVKENFDIDISKATAHRLFKRLGFSYITPRPSHYKKDKTSQAKFKKKS
ncbi:hypothetical protein EDM53_04425 [Rickettsiales endosymbiont of Peranema trichophorum]|uniref:winged helix-turn-helix domain-containing protein n=1 Tax=Rickettsiales endosymbiont of Peranema trichophorum TaxID=2486577 RepID=UPI00102341C0|nr:winged helix-turn-helix domain-containing protein [Rickettsiales endosymbiont of Peranema trichophorum]RZI46011.1 hypothetical protein EDM53_04425 [Rickettsiales endosymbiont of Peranema trichophorum]